MFDAPVANLVLQERIWGQLCGIASSSAQLFKSRPLVPQERISDRFVVRNMDNHVPQNVDEIAVVMPLIPQVRFQQSTEEDIFDPSDPGPSAA